MTKIAVLTDTHANLPALEAALAAISELECEAIYHTGDAVGAGPFPEEVLDRLLHTPNMHLVMGNHDELCAFGMPTPVPDWVDDLFVANTVWTRAQVSPEVRRSMASWPYELAETRSGVQMAFLHYPLAAADGGFAPIVLDPSGADLDALFVNQHAELIFYGHHHPVADYTSRARYINPGALGCSPDASARFTVVDVARSGSVEIQHHAVPYDRTPLYDALHYRDVPARDFLRQAFFL